VNAAHGREELPYGLPRVRDLTREGSVRRTADGLAELVLVSRGQLTNALRGIPRIDELPRPSGRPFMQFVSFGPGYLGIPLCPPGGDGRTCWPIKGGPDDNPLAFVCVCRIDPPLEEPPLRPPCYLDLTSPPLRLRCIRGACTRTCRLVAASVGKGRLRGFQVGCTCS